MVVLPFFFLSFLEVPKDHSSSAGAGSSSFGSIAVGSVSFLPFFFDLAVPQPPQSSSAISSTTGIDSTLGSSRKSVTAPFFFFFSFLDTEVKPKSKESSSFFSSGGSGAFTGSSSSTEPKEKGVFFFFGFPRLMLQGLLSISASFLVSVADAAVVAVVAVVEKSQPVAPVFQLLPHTPKPLLAFAVVEDVSKVRSSMGPGSSNLIS